MTAEDRLLNDRSHLDIYKERVRAHEKHKAGGASMEESHWQDPMWLPVLGEEYGELCRAICELRHRTVTLDEHRVHLREELVQVGAMTSAWIAAIDAEEREKLAPLMAHVAATKGGEEPTGHWHAALFDGTIPTCSACSPEPANEPIPEAPPSVPPTDPVELVPAEDHEGSDA